MISPDGRHVIVYNGEIYNAPELKTDLEAEGVRFRGHSDTEVLLHACIRWGVVRALQRCAGMFAFALWNTKTRQLALARDRLGKKPLYFAKIGNGLIFGSELRALMQHPHCPREIDGKAVASLLRFAYIPAPHSIFAGVQKLPPATILTVDGDTGDYTSQTFWNLAEVMQTGSGSVIDTAADGIVQDVLELLRKCTSQRLMSDVPLGAFLSGGIDSSLVTALMQEASRSPIKTFSIGYDDPDYNEAGHAAKVAAHLGTDHTELIVSPGDAMKVIPELASIYDEPFADSSQIPTFLVSRLAREQVKVCLSGDGGDEVFFGYNRHVAAYGLLGRLQALPQPVRNGLAGVMTMLSPDAWQALLRPLPASLQPRMVGEKIHKLASVMTLSPEQQYKRLSSQWWSPLDAIGSASEYATQIDAPLPACLGRDPAAAMRYLDLCTYLPGDILTKVDRATMAVGLEARSPLLDHRLIELSCRIPTSVHLTQGQGKWILRQILGKYVPQNLFERPKMGFGIPIGHWLRSDLRDWAEDLLSQRSLGQTALLNVDAIRKVWNEHLSGKTNNQHQLWTVLMFQAWVRKWHNEPLKEVDTGNG